MQLSRSMQGDNLALPSLPLAHHRAKMLAAKKGGTPTAKMEASVDSLPSHDSRSSLMGRSMTDQLSRVDPKILTGMVNKLKGLRAKKIFSMAATAMLQRSKHVSATFETRDKQAITEIFRSLKMVGQGEMLRERLPEAMAKMGYREVNNEWLTEITKEVLGDGAESSFLDFNEVLAVVEAYRKRNMKALETEFHSFLPEGVKTMSQEEVCTALETQGILLVPGIVRQLLAEVELSTEEISVAEYIYLRQVVQYRGGFLQTEADHWREIYLRWDEDQNGSMSFRELEQALRFLDFELSCDAEERKQRHSQLLEAVTSGVRWTSDDGINLQDFLQVMRRYREIEIALARKIFKQHAAGQETVDAEAALSIIHQLGYITATWEVITDWAQDLGLADRVDFSLDDLYMLFTKVHANEGFGKAELKEISSAFLLHDTNNSGSVDVVELGGVLRWLGYHTAMEQQQDLIDDVDMDGSGEIDFDELLKIMRWYKEEEFKNLQRAYVEGDTDGSGTLDKKEVQLVLPSLGLSKLTREQIGLVDACFVGDREIDFKECVKLVKTLRTQIREEFRSTHGYQGKELEIMKQSFLQGARMDSSGHMIMNGKEIIKIFEAQFPGTVKTAEDRARAAEMLRKVDSDQDGRLGWYEFLHLMRMAQDRADFDAVSIEQEAIEKCGFNRAEVRDLRKAFKLCDTNMSKYLELEEFIRMLSCMRPLTRPLQERLAVLAKEADKDKKNGLSFPEFLLVMRQVQDEHICDLGPTTPDD